MIDIICHAMYGQATFNIIVDAPSLFACSSSRIPPEELERARRERNPQGRELQVLEAGFRAAQKGVSHILDHIARPPEALERSERDAVTQRDTLLRALKAAVGAHDTAQEEEGFPDGYGGTDGDIEFARETLAELTPQPVKQED